MQPGRIISQVSSGQEITITYRGKPRAKIIPIVSKSSINFDEPDAELFGIWKNKKDINNVDQFIRNMRKGRKL